MSVARQLQNRNRLHETTGQALSNNVPRQAEAAPHPIDIQRFPSSTISNETFMHIDDSWPKEAESTSKRGRLFSIFIRWKIWIFQHRIISIVVAIVVLLILLIAIAAVIVVVVIKESCDGSLVNTTSSLSLTTTAPNLSTTSEPYAEGAFGGLAVRCYWFNFLVPETSLRPDRRQNASYILTTPENISLLGTSAASFLPETVWVKEDITPCRSEDLTLAFSPYNEVWERCEVFDILDDCRRAAALCSDSSLIYCCQNGKSNTFLCSVYGIRFENKDSTFLDAAFQFLSAQEQIFKFSFVSIDNTANSCLLGSRKILVLNGTVTSVEYPAKVWLFDQFGFHVSSLLSIAIEQNDEQSWGSILTNSGTLYVTNFANISHKVDGLVNDNESKLRVGSYGGSNFISDITADKFSFVKVNQLALAVLNPKIEPLTFPGTFVGAFLNDGNIIEYHISNNSLLIAEIIFFWDF